MDGSCNVTWSEYYIYPVRWLVVGFPALDVLSVYPMNVIIAANNVMAIVYDDTPDGGGRLQQKEGGGQDSMDTPKI